MAAVSLGGGTKQASGQSHPEISCLECASEILCSFPDIGVSYRIMPGRQQCTGSSQYVLLCKTKPVHSLKLAGVLLALQEGDKGWHVQAS